MTARCNCENASGSCDHGKGDAFKACLRPAGRGTVEFLGEVCDTCWHSYPERYRVDSPESLLVAIGRHEARIIEIDQELARRGRK